MHAILPLATLLAEDARRHETYGQSGGVRYVYWSIQLSCFCNVTVVSDLPVSGFMRFFEVFECLVESFDAVNSLVNV